MVTRLLADAAGALVGFGAMVGVLWLRRRRPSVLPRVRVHVLGKAGVEPPSVEGLLEGVKGGHYVIQRPKLLQPDRSVTLKSPTLQIPVDRVLFYEELGS